MEVKKTKSNLGPSWLYRNRRKAIYLLIILLFILNSIASLTYGYYKYREAYQLKNVFDLATSPVSTLINFVKGKLSSVEVLQIDIKFKDFQKLSYKKEISLSKKVLETSSDDYVPAEITYNGEVIKTKIRLKGDWARSTTESDKWSYRIKVKGDETIMGMKMFSLHHPKERVFLYEWLFHNTLEREGLLNLKYNFINVVINGKDFGIYAIEEHFDKRLIERNKKREGPIIRFKEDIVWNQGNVYPGGIFWDATYDMENYYIADISGFRTGNLSKDSSALLLYKKAAYNLNAFRNGEKKASEVFDAKLLARFLAVSDLFGAWHANRWHNKRFYYNPISQKLEPIGFDGMPIKLFSLVYTHPRLRSIHTVFQDTTIFELYIQELERISDKNYLDSLLLDNKEEINDKLNILYKEFYDAGYFDDFEILTYNQEYIRKAINPVNAIQAYFTKWHDDSIQLYIGNIQSMPIEITSLVLNDSIVLSPVGEYIIAPKPRLRPAEYKVYTFKVSEKIDWSDKLIGQLKLEYNVFGSKTVRSEAIYKWNYFEGELFANNVFSIPSDLNSFEFINVDEENKSIFIQAGNWDLDQNLIIPNGYTLYAAEGVRINLINSANILSGSPIEFIGTEEDQIYIYSEDSTGQGVFVSECDQESYLRFVNFVNLSNPKMKDWSLSGSVNFYESNVKISNSTFRDNRCEDALNIIRSEFEIGHSKFRNTFSDAFDGDFTSGNIHNTTFENCGNDGIDVSGSYIRIENIYVENASDKAISIGENSQLHGRQLKILNTEIGITSKDLSKIQLTDIELIDTKVGFTAFQKKSEYGPAEIDVSNVIQRNVEMPYLIENGSVMLVDGKSVGMSNEKVKEMLYGIKYGKSSK